MSDVERACKQAMADWESGDYLHREIVIDALIAGYHRHRAVSERSGRTHLVALEDHTARTAAMFRAALGVLGRPFEPEDDGE